MVVASDGPKTLVLSGEEFAAFFPETDAATSQKVVERIRSELERHRFTFENREIALTVSAGLADFQSGDTAESLLSRADTALYRAKKEGRNRVIVFS